MARAWIGISGYDYPGWRGDFYPEELARTRWLRYASHLLDSIELNGTFYSLKSPDVFRRWEAETPPGFVFAVKGSRFITHNLKLRRAAGPLANFLASGVLALGAKTGPFLWQLPDSYAFDAERIGAFLRLLPRTSRDAASLARGHDDRLKRGALTEAEVDVPYRHAMEVRHESYFVPEFFELLRRHDVGYVVADTAGRWKYAEEVTAGFVYVRLHGSRRLYTSGYRPRELDAWAEKVRVWRAEGRDVYVYFDNDARGFAPHDAVALRGRLAAEVSVPAASGAAAAGTTAARRPRPPRPAGTRRPRHPS
jgi:uncharacterized protein YecE (DUF72 family)